MINMKRHTENNLATYAWLDKTEDTDDVWNQEKKILKHGDILFST